MDLRGRRSRCRRKVFVRRTGTIANADDKILAEETRLEMHLLARLGSRVRRLRVVCQDNGIILQGRTRTYYAKQLAQHTVMEMTDLPILANEIEVC